MDPERSTAEGVKLLRQYLQYVESDGTNLGDQVPGKPALNPFEVDVRDTLLRHGLKLTAQYGTSGYWIDFAVQHPAQPGRYVLAIECDGATYHSSRSARDRDRLRQEQLERKGWRFHRIWSAEWFHDKQACTEKAIAAYHAAVRAADEDQQATPATLTTSQAHCCRPPAKPPCPGPRRHPRCPGTAQARARGSPAGSRSRRTPTPNCSAWRNGSDPTTSCGPRTSYSKR